MNDWDENLSFRDENPREERDGPFCSSSCNRNAAILESAGILDGRFPVTVIKRVGMFLGRFKSRAFDGAVVREQNAALKIPTRLCPVTSASGNW